MQANLSLRALVMVSAVAGLLPARSDGQTCQIPTYSYYTGNGELVGNVVFCEYQPRYCDGTDAGPLMRPAPKRHPQCSPGPSGTGVCAPSPETCSESVGDSNCNGAINENCTKCDSPFGGRAVSAASSQGGDCCGNTVGADPILIGSRAAVTEPFTDFSVERVSRLSLSRTYNSADATAPTTRTFSKGWHHDWEAFLTCSTGRCMLVRGLLAGFQFVLAGTYPSPDGTESWALYASDASPYAASYRHYLVEKPSGEFVLYLTDGQALHFQPACNSCDGATSPYCTAVHSGGRARLSRVVDEVGNGVSVSYDPASGVPLRLTDDLGHSLELRGTSACPTLASELRYDGAVVARYTPVYGALDRVADADGAAMRSYVYAAKLQGVKDGAGALIAEFSYDAYSKAIGVVDAASSVGVSYLSDGDVVTTEYFRGPLGDASQTSVRKLDFFGKVTQIDAGCSCGPAKATGWTLDGLPGCTIDASGRVTVKEYDASRRVSHEVQFNGGSCAIPSPLPPDAREEWREYGLTRTVVQGVAVELDKVTRVVKRSGLVPGSYSEEVDDFSQAPATFDPPGYACAASPFPEGSLPCRHLSGGWVTGASGPVYERHVTFFTYDARGRKTKTTGPINVDRPGPNDVTPVEERTYWGDGESSARQGRLREVKRYPGPTAPPLVTAYDYDLFGVSSVTEPDGRRTSMTKDGRGRPRIVTSYDALGAVTATYETRYYDGTSPRLIILPTGAAKRFSYDGRGRLQKVEYLSGDPEAAGATPTVAWSESYVHDQAGNQIHAERRDTLGAITWQQDRAYDVQHHVVWESNPSLPAAARVTTYDAGGFLAAITDEEARTTSFTPDPLGRVKQVERSGRDALGAPASTVVAGYQYVPGQDQLSQVVAGNGLATSYVYDDFGRVERVTSATIGGGAVSFEYDARGNVVKRTDAGATVTYRYDGLDRMTSLQATAAQGGASLAYTYRYDENGYAGRLTTVVEPERTVTFSYDGAGRLRSEVLAENGVAVPLTTQYGYDAGGAMTHLTYPSGLTVRFDRDRATGEVTAVTNVSSGYAYASTVKHLPGGPVSALTFGNGRTLSQTFNQRYEPLAVQSGPLWLTYTPTPAGDLGAVADQSEDVSGCVRSVTRELKYDHQDRLAGWSDATAGGVGVCPLETLGSQVGAFTYVSGTDRVASQRVPDLAGPQAYAYGYDGAGSLSAIARYDASGTTQVAAVCLRHDLLGRLVLAGPTGTVVSAGGTACTSDAEVTSAQGRFKYDSRNRRVARQAGGQWTYVVSDGAGSPLSELALTGGTWTKVRDYVWLEGRLVAQVEYAGVQAWEYAVHVDHLGTPRALSNRSGQVVWSTYQRPYGEVQERTVVDPVSGRTVVTNVRLPGQYDERLLGSLGLQGPYYNWNRWYLPGVGRYLELDPIAHRGDSNALYGVDWHNYASLNPITTADPTGETPIYGYYCGPDWTGGRATQYSPDKDKDFAPPVDALDSACREHDICYYQCRRSFPCNKSARSACFRNCDAALSIAARNKGGFYGGAVAKAMDRPGTRDPEKNGDCCD